MDRHSDASDKDEKFLTVREAAKLLKVSTQTIKNYIYSGKIKSFKTPGGQHRIMASDLPWQVGEFFVEKQEEMPNIFENDIREMRRAYLLTLRTLLYAIDKRNSVPGGHSERVARYSIMIANEMGFSAEEKEQLEFAALMHDVGKVGIDDRILNKPGRLTEEEFSEVKRHPEIGEEIIKQIKQFATTASLVRHHHERFDGSGYPDGLMDGQIPLGSRIISVAEVYDFLVSPASFRSPWTSEEAVSELKRCVSSQFDPEVVGVFVQALEKR